MFIKQLSVFIENEEGRLEEVLDVLKTEQINIISLSLADTSEYGLLRLITSDPEAGQAALKNKGFAAMLTDVLAIRLTHQVGKLQEILSIVCKAGLNVEYMYILSNKEENASIICKISNGNEAAQLLQSQEVELYSQEDMNRLFHEQ